MISRSGMHNIGIQQIGEKWMGTLLMIRVKRKNKHFSIFKAATSTSNN